MEPKAARYSRTFLFGTLALIILIVVYLRLDLQSIVVISQQRLEHTAYATTQGDQEKQHADSPAVDYEDGGEPARDTVSSKGSRAPRAGDSPHQILEPEKIAGFHEKLQAGLRGGRGTSDADTVNLFVPRGEILDVQHPTGMDSASIDDVCTQDKRRSALEAACERHRDGIDSDVDFNNPSLYRNFIVDDKHQVIYCSIAKVSCTVWKDLLALRSGYFTLDQLLTPQDDGRIPAFLLHRYGFFKKHTKLYHLSELPVDEIREKLEGYKKMMIVRNPFSRLYSGYSDKMVIENKGFSFASHIRVLYQNLTLTNGGYFITFEQFLNMLSRGNLPEYSETKLKGFANNGHWRSMASSCHPCHVHYDYIAKLETMNTDKYNLFRWFNATDKDLLSTTRPSYTKYTNVFNYTLPHVKDIYKTIPEDLLADIRKVYRYDMELFGYDYDKQSGPVCKTEGPGKSCC